MSPYHTQKIIRLREKEGHLISARFNKYGFMKEKYKAATNEGTTNKRVGTLCDNCQGNGTLCLKLLVPGTE